MRSFLFGINLVFFLSLTAHAWGPIGHRVVAELAQRHLTVNTKRKVTQILSGQSLTDVALWADDMKTDPKLKSTAVLHYVDIPDGMRFEDMDQNAKKLTVVSAIQSLKSFLKTKNENDLIQVPPLEGISRPEALKFLIHFIGDLHQPLHVGGKNDRGGNDFKVLFLSQERPSNLHSVWDSLLIENQELSFTEYADLLERKNYKGHDISPALTFDFSGWANEGVAVRDQIYNLTKDGKTQIPQVNHDYILKNRDLLESRLMLAGHRLAQILNDIFSK